MKKADEIIAKIFEDAPDFKQELSIFQNWNSIVGEKLEKLTRPVDIVNNTLVVAVSHPAAAQMIRLNERELLKNIEKSFGVLQIEKIEIQLVDNMLIKKKEASENRYETGKNTVESEENPSYPQRSFNEILNEFRKRAE